MFPVDPQLQDWLSDTRRYFHRHPEISHQEKRTTQKIIEILKDLNIDTRPLEDMTGAIGLIEGKSKGLTIALRADIDALPIQELGDVEYASQNTGVMHACGHDANTAIMLGVAKTLMESGRHKDLKGNVKFLFQPAEERGAGAKAMIERGALENPRVDRIIAGHMSPDLPAGKVGIFRGLGYASADRFNLVITGKGAHGARPEEGNDPIVAGAQFVSGIQSIVARNIKPTEAAVITVGKFNSGAAENVIPESAHLAGSIRALSPDIRLKVHQRLAEFAAGLEKSFHVRCELNILEGVPTLENDIEVAEFLFEVSQSVLGAEHVQYLPPIMGSEDFSYFTLERPSAIMRLGCSNPEKGFTARLHSPHFDIDEQVLGVGTAIFSTVVLQYLS
ncbi:MAG: M20 family metallopeptidase [Desulfobacterales bacterium]|jgi:amidohydrolase|nr:amidohydrolase [Deltaproteobacteria bacterium]